MIFVISKTVSCFDTWANRMGALCDVKLSRDMVLRGQYNQYHLLLIKSVTLCVSSSKGKYSHFMMAAYSAYFHWFISERMLPVT